MLRNAHHQAHGTPQPQPEPEPQEQPSHDGDDVPEGDGTETIAGQSAEEREKADAQEGHERSAATARVVYHAILEEGAIELARPTSGLAYSAVAAGLSMGFSLVTEGLLESHLPDRTWRPLIVRFGYAMGFLIVVLGRQQLFTENTLTAVLPLLKHRSFKVFRSVMRLWLVVLVCNLVGAAIFAWVVARTPAFDEDVKRSFLHLGMEATQNSFGVVLLRGIFAGWLIALMVWLLPVAETNRVWVIILITYVVGLGPSSHIIVGSVEAIYTVAAHQHTWADYFLRYATPSLLGNIIGGVSLVAALNHAQVTAGKDTSPAGK